MLTMILADGKQVDEANKEPDITFLWRNIFVTQERDTRPKAPFALTRKVGLENFDQWRLMDARGWLVLIATGDWDATPEAKLKELLVNISIARYGLHEDEEDSKWYPIQPPGEFYDG